MHYKYPVIDDKPQWVPIVVKNKDYLVGYIEGIQLISEIVTGVLNNHKISIDLSCVDPCIDSSRFNDILENGKREADCSNEYLKKYYENIVKNRIELLNDTHPENKGEFENEIFFQIQCNCGLGIYIFKTANEIPEEPLKCSNCGRTIIDYTGCTDDKIEFEGQRKIINLSEENYGIEEEN